MSYFDLLGVAQDAPEIEIEHARTWLAEALHPDQLPGASAAVRSQFDEAMARVDEAYNALKDPKSRSEYEAWLGDQGPRRSRPPGAEECRLCGSAPAVPLRFTHRTAFGLRWTSTTMSGTFCSGCARCYGRAKQKRTLVTGWWSLTTLFLNWATVFNNTRALLEARRLSEPRRDPDVVSPLAAPLPG